MVGRKLAFGDARCWWRDPMSYFKVVLPLLKASIGYSQPFFMELSGAVPYKNSWAPLCQPLRQSLT